MKVPLREQIFTVIARIPAGRVTSYGRIADMTDGATPRMVASSLKHLPPGHGLPWHRVISSTGKVADHTGAEKQKRLLCEEGVLLDSKQRISSDIWWP
ncbi:DNA base-flipping protein [Halomonadaceae bacterium LMG 33818]|uniref:MGMT family protein n=1 Tax=Cernens ardua TaxID=3402176 RepID=UPI003EDBBB9C